MRIFHDKTGSTSVGDLVEDAYSGDTFVVTNIREDGARELRDARPVDYVQELFR